MQTLRSRFLVAGAVLACAGSQANAEAIFGLTLGNSLVVFDSATPGSTSAPIPVTGLAAGQTLVGIDFRPLTRQLVGVAAGPGGTGAVYAINPFTGAATSVNTIPVLTGTAFGVDFNPVPDALRVSDANQSLRITVGGTGVVNTDGTLNPGDPNVVGAAYSNNVPGGINGQTTLYVIDSALNSLLTQGGINFPPGVPPVSPNTGTLFPVGALGFDTSDLVGFDISRDTAIAYASLTTPGGPSQLFTVNLGLGAATLVGGIGSGVVLRDITVSQLPEPGTLAFLAVALFVFVAMRRGATP